jgi:hypothetical protein
MAMIEYVVRRRVPAENEAGNDMLIALCFIRHENGLIQRHCIPEDKIAYCGEGIIDLEVREAALKEGTYLKDTRQ